MSDQSRDWDKELADIDRMMSKQGNAPIPAPPASRVGPGPAAVRPAAVPATRKHHVALTWLLVLLGIGLAAALPFWPYVRACGLGLGGYFAGILALLIVATSAAASAWRHRRPVAHIVALLTILAGLGYAAAEVLPRVHYAARAATWLCP
jgi:hypothetical protein